MAKSVFEKAEADNLAVQYSPRKFPFRISETAKDFVAYQEANAQTSGFRIDPMVAGQTGVSELERISIEERVDQEALRKFQEVQEAAYAEGRALGLEEGKKLAFAQHEIELREQIRRFEKVLEALENLKIELVHFNESHILKLIFYLAGRVAMTEIQMKPELIVEVIRKAVESSQEQEQVTVFLSHEDATFISENREKFGREGEFLKKLRLEERPQIQSGGCVIETNYGVVDSTIDQRISKLWESLSEKIPRVKDSVSTP